MISLRFEGGQELAAALAGLSARVSQSVVSGALLEAGEPMRTVITRIAPRRPGAPDLADNILLSPLRRRSSDEAGDVSVGLGVPRAFFYDWFVEYGTVHMGSHPFWRPGFDSTVQSSIGIVGRAMWRELASRGIGRSVNAPTTVQSDGSFQ